MTELYHQLGYRFQWNINSILENETGSGAIIAARYMSKDDVEALPVELRQRSIFDPQFYLPNSTRGELANYNFFPDVVANGFQTAEWTPEQAIESAMGCLEFQLANEFRYCIIPTRVRDGMPTDFIESQTFAFVDPFLVAYNNLGSSIPCLLQLILTDQMLKDKGYRTNILNWVTGLEEIEGVYLIYKYSRTHKQIQDTDFLLAVDHFVTSLKQAGMVVVMGYLNTESIPLLCSNPDIITMGGYENMRIFNTLSMEELDPNKKMRGPNARIYSSRLLQWIEYDYLGAIAQKVTDFDTYFEDNDQKIAMFKPDYKWHFNRSEPYVHYFEAFGRQFQRLNSQTGIDRVKAVRAEITNAIAEFERLEQAGVTLDVDSGGRHLYSWNNFLNQRNV